MAKATTKKSIEGARKAGRGMADRGGSYSDNPWGNGYPEEKLAWSQGHNETRSAILYRRDIVPQ